MNPGIAILSKLKNRYILIRLIEILLLSISVALISLCVFYLLNVSLTKEIVLTAFVTIIVFFLRFFQLGLHKVSEESIAVFLNTRYTELKGSTDLVLEKEINLSQLAKLQQIRTNENLELLKKNVRFPNQIKNFFFLAVAGIAALVLIQLNGLTFNSNHFVNTVKNNITQEDGIIKDLPSEITEGKVTVTPPVYTSILSYALTDLNLMVQENSKVTWSLKFSGKIKSAGMITSSRDTIQFSLQQNVWKLTSTLARSGFYQFIWEDETIHTSEYYKIGIIKDQSPTIKLTGLNQFTQVAYDSKQAVEANPTINDDYGLTDAYIIATVSKGSGESVKFREEKIRFSAPQQIRGKQISAKQLLDLKKLGLEPGDELYFYVEAFDNKTPIANRSRTETYFIAIPDTAQDVMAAEGGLGVDLMPEYFRSQRQIIIDTEKLIREKKSITKKEFNSRSNELGYDQKVLRLRYGQFLGEEEESGIAPIDQHVEEDYDANEKPEDMIKEFGHQHDTENEHNLVEEKDPAKKDVDGGKKEDLLADFVHQHDTEESATFFYQSLKMKLKAALAQMWDAELYLRLYEPDKSLPYQYTALKLLKEISNDSRIYVHRTGFEPPPIKEEKRLSADLKEVFNSTRNYDAIIKEYFPKISEALAVTERLIARQASRLTQNEKSILLQSGSELAQAALENPALLKGLSALNELTTQPTNLKIETLKTLRKSYWLSLPTQPAQTDKNNSTVHELDNKFIQQLELLEQ